MQETRTATPMRVNAETRLGDLRLDSYTHQKIHRNIARHCKVTVPKLLSFETVQDVVDYVLITRNKYDQKELLMAFFRDGWSSIANVNNSIANELIEEINRKNPRRVLDIGCGNNFFKDKIHNLIGVDIVNPRADVICDFIDFDAHGDKFDIILALGSINFGGRQHILSLLRRVKTILMDHGTVYMRVNPGVSWPQQPELIIYPWSENKILLHGADVGFALNGNLKFEHGPYGRRISFKYVHSLH